MLNVVGTRHRSFCDGLSRRTFLKIGGLALGGLSLPEILRAEAAGNQRLGHKGIIMIYLPGGPPHQDMFDLKTEAPAEIRGEFRPIRTNVPGIEICEHFPRIAKMADKLAIIRSIVGCGSEHAAFQCLTGRTKNNQPPGGWPSLGSTLSKLQGPVNPGMPPFVGLAPKMGHMPWADPGEPGYLGISHAPFRPEGRGAEDMTLKGLSVDRLNDRHALLTSFDRFRRDADASGMMRGMDSFTEQAFGVLTSSRLLDALDISREDAAVRERYGHGDPHNRDDGGPKLMEQFLAARRLIEAGARCVTLAFSRWDWHSDTFNAGRQDMPMLDQGLSALLTDLAERGLERDVSVVVWGEFGRTPVVNKEAGRDHWPRVSCALLAGGGLRTGQVIGATDKTGGEPKDRPVQFSEVFATLYHALGINANRVTQHDLAGRPQYLVDYAEPMAELI